jgi:hypothetical protein
MAFFGVAMRRMKETDTWHLSVGYRESWHARTTRGVVRVCIGAAARVGSSAPGDVIQRSRPKECPQ